MPAQTKPKTKTNPQAEAKSTASEIARTAETEAEAVRAKLQDAEAEAESTASRVAREAKDAVADTAQRLKNKGVSEAHGARDTAADQLHERAKSFREAAQEVRDYPAQYHAIEEIADRMDRTADAIQRTDIRQVPDDIAAFARRNPVVFLGGAALLGFALARFIKASDRPDLS